MNTISVAGRLASEPQMGQTSNGKNYLRFSLAEQTKAGTKQANGTYEGGHSNFYGVTLWDKDAEFNAHLSKGDRIAVMGSLKIEEFEGKKHVKIEFAKVLLVSSDNNAGGTTTQQRVESAPQATQMPTAQPQQRNMQYDDDLPF